VEFVAAGSILQCKEWQALLDCPLARMFPELTPVHVTFTLTLELATRASHSSSTFRTHPIQNAGDHFPSRSQSAVSHK
jgi:hypothetical protein